MKELKVSLISFILILITSIYIASTFYNEVTLVTFLNSIFLVSLGSFTLALMDFVLKSGFLDRFHISFRKSFFQEYELGVKNKRQSSISISIITSVGTITILTLIISILLL